MFSQNVFSSKDVLSNTNQCENNAWDSQQYSQGNSYSQNSQYSSMDLFSQHKGSGQSRNDHYHRSQSQNLEDESSNYYCKYAKNPPLFNSSTNNTKLQQSIKDIIEDQKRQVSMKEEKDLLQTFINLLKDYTKQVDETFENFKEYMTKSFEDITKGMSDESKNYKDDFNNLKEELMKSIEKTEQESNEKEKIKMNLLEQRETVKVLESKIEALEEQLSEAKEKESTYIEEKKKYEELQEKYFESVKQLKNGDASIWHNTPPLSQPKEPLCTLWIPPLREQNIANDTSQNIYGATPMMVQREKKQVPPGYNIDIWEGSNKKIWKEPQEYYTTQSVTNSLQIDPIYQEAMYNVPHHIMSCQPRNDTRAIFVPADDTAPYNNVLASKNMYPCNFNNEVVSAGNNSQQSSLVISRRGTKRPKQSPMAMVKPQLRHDSSDEDIFFTSVKNDPSYTSDHHTFKPSQLELAPSFNHYTKTKKIIYDNVDITPAFSQKQLMNEGKGFRQEESVRRKRSLVSMLGKSSDDLELQEITNAIKEQQRMLVKKIRSVN